MQERDPFEVDTFGDLLKALRKRQRLSQQQLAERLGVHRNTIGTWERGDFLPDSKGAVLELARQLRLDHQETRHLLEASLTALSTYWCVPYTRNPFFTGREKLLHALHLRLAQTQEGGYTALSGLGGIGKTQVALEYAYLHAEEYSAVLWCNASTRDTLLTGFQHIAHSLQLTTQTTQIPPEHTASVLRWLTSHTGWLLIFDNVEELALLAEFLPPAREGSVLLTTRLTTLQGLGQLFQLQSFTAKEGRAFLSQRLSQHVLPPATSQEQHVTREHAPLAATPQEQHTPGETVSRLDELVEALGGLPLALDQAANYIEETQSQPDEYLRLLASYPVELLQARASHIGGHPLSVLATFQCSFEQVQRQSPPAAHLLMLCSFLAGENIPEQIIRQSTLALPPEIRSTCTDPLQYHAALKVLLSYSLIARHAQTHMLSMHRLVQLVLRAGLPSAEHKRWLAVVVDMLEQLFPLDLAHEDYWQACAQLLPHCVLVLQEAEQWEIASHTLARLQAKVASYLLARTRYEEAEPYSQHASEILEQLAEATHPDMIYILSIQATLAIVQGRYTQALQSLQQAIQVSEYTSDHPYQVYTAYCLSKLAALYSELNRVEEATLLFQQALYRCQIVQTGEAEHPLVATAYCELAQLCMQQGQISQASALFQQAIQLCEQSPYGEQHPHLAISLSNLASLYARQGRYQEAQALTRRFIQLSEQGLQTRHPYMY